LEDEISITFGTGEVWGHCLRDHICVGHICDQGSFISTTYESQNPFEFFAFDGVLGLALPQMSQGVDFNLMWRLGKSRVLRQPKFAVFFSDDDAESSEITFGDIKAERLASDLVWVDIARESGYWELQMVDITIDNKLRQLCVDCYVAVDTGTSELAGPSDVIERLSELIDVQRDCSNFFELPQLGFVFDGHILNLEPHDYIDRSGGRCDVAFMPLDVPPPNGPLFVLGIPFLQRFYTVYDTEARKIGFGVSKHRGQSDGTAARRLIRGRSGKMLQVMQNTSLTAVPIK
jgi:saccharopepsin